MQNTKNDIYKHYIALNFRRCLCFQKVYLNYSRTLLQILCKLFDHPQQDLIVGDLKICDNIDSSVFIIHANFLEHQQLQETV